MIDWYILYVVHEKNYQKDSGSRTRKYQKQLSITLYNIMLDYVIYIYI